MKELNKNKKYINRISELTEDVKFLVLENFEYYEYGETISNNAVKMIGFTDKKYLDMYIMEKIEKGEKDFKIIKNELMNVKIRMEIDYD